MLSIIFILILSFLHEDGVGYCALSRSRKLYKRLTKSNNLLSLTSTPYDQCKITYNIYSQDTYLAHQCHVGLQNPLTT